MKKASECRHHADEGRALAKQTAREDQREEFLKIGEASDCSADDRDQQATSSKAGDASTDAGKRTNPLVAGSTIA
jgi:hypothetical protein